MTSLGEEDIIKLFDSIDVSGRGALSITDLAQLCPDLGKSELEFVFQQLDLDQNGEISKEEFRTGFETVINGAKKMDATPAMRRASVSLETLSNQRPPLTNRKSTTTEYMYENLGADDRNIDQLSCKEDLLALYQQLQTNGVPELLGGFEKVVGQMFKDIQEQKQQTELLQKNYQKEREIYSKQISEVETELDQQIAMAEARARKEERERLEREKEGMRERMENEILELQSNVKRLQKLESVLAGTSEKSEKYGELKEKLETIREENRRLKGSLATAQANVSMVKVEMAQIRNEYDDRCLDLLNEKDNLIATIQEQEHLAHQLNLLNNANQKLHDTNDNLRSSLETRQAVCRRFNLRSPSPLSQDSLSPQSREASFSSITSGGRLPGDQNHSRPNRLPVRSWDEKTGQYAESLEDDRDSGFTGITSMDSLSTADGYGSSGVMSPRRGYPSEKDLMPHQGIPSDLSASDDDDLTPPNTPGGLPRAQNRRSASSRAKNHHRKSSGGSSAATVTDQLTEEPQKRPHRPKSNRRHASKRDHGENRENSVDGPPERTFRVVMAGDASVGKSSFIMRLCKGKFMPSIPSTLGVDYHVKTVNVDGKIVAVQLWDTAGQERFRSLCKSYFRRADGAMMMYDCTCEQSFLNVRNWMETIRENAPKTIPILICGNKIDSRVQATTEGKNTVAHDDGEKLAKLYGATFIEISAKDGTNVKKAVQELARELLVSEDIEVTGTSLVLKSDGEQKNKCCSKL